MSIIPPAHHTAPPPPVTSPGPDISRPRLKHFAYWIRDDLDVLVAREGSDALRADDVVMLHDLFVTLRHATAITALDLRATGIHKAVMAIAGVASRWPKRLCDDSDKIIAIWTSKFGPLDEIYPFLYGRRGRLESIASQSEYSSEALLKRWSQQCAQKVDPSVSHKQGSLGFTAGDWWISSLFAHHAGIIGSESIEGGTTYDKDAAYALVLKNATGLDAWDEELVTHRFSSNDKGKFRLTSATAKSRNPIRVLRNHSTSSILGPRAGIRYEGLYVVKGWTIRQAKLDDALSGRCKVGDIMYEVSLQRQDPVPMVEVTKRPNSEEVDDYMEYKRLRKHHRETNREEPGYTSPLPDVGPFLQRLQVPANPANPPRSLLRILPSISRTNTSGDPAIEGSKTTLGSYVLPSTSKVSPLGMSGQIHSFFPLGKVDDGSYFIKRGTIDVATSLNKASVSDALGEKNARDSRSSIARSIADELKEILPWHELDEEPSTPTSPVLHHATY